MYRIVVVAVNSPQDYSGGRYHAWMMVEALAALGHEVSVWTNHLPVFLPDFKSFPAHGKIRIFVDKRFARFPQAAFDIVVMVPHMGEPLDLFYKTMMLARHHEARLVLLNFETPNWFNAFSPEPRSPRMWNGWRAVASISDLVLSSAREGTRWAKAFYHDVPAATRFVHCYP